MDYRKFENKNVEKTFDGYPDKVRDKLLILREFIFQIADENNDIGEIEETLKWDNPSYLTHKPKTGTTIRLSNISSDENKFAIFVHCQTNLISEFRKIYPDLIYDGNRCIVFKVNQELAIDKIKHFIFLALTYHNRKK